MHKRYSIWSVVFVVIGILIAIEPYTALQLWPQSSWADFFLVVLIGLGIYAIGVILGITAFAKREKGLLKYVSVITVIIGILFVGMVN